MRKSPTNKTKRIDENANTTLICGLNGVGKRTFAKMLAKEIGYRFVDIEDVCFQSKRIPVIDVISASLADRFAAGCGK